MSSSQVFTEVLQDWVEVFMHRSFRDFKRFMDDSGLSASQVNTLMRLYHLNTCGVTDIAQSLGITNAATSQLVDKLVGYGLIDRSEDRQDRRVRQITLTDRGRHMIQEGMTAWRGWMEELATTLPGEDLEAITGALKLLTEAARHMEVGSREGQTSAKQKDPTSVNKERDHLDRRR
jgi:DNA-binding MarR family transcriptional regulator